MKSIQLVGLLVLSLSACTLLHTVEAALPDVASQATATRPPNVFCGSRSDGAYLLFTPTHPASAQNPAFLPDGKWIAFESHKNENEDSPTSLWMIAVPNLNP